MSRERERHLLRGTMAGIAGGLIASWVMNKFMAGPGEKLEESVRGESPQKQQNTEEEDSTIEGG